MQEKNFLEQMLLTACTQPPFGWGFGYKDHHAFCRWAEGVQRMVHRIQLSKHLSFKVRY